MTAPALQALATAQAAGVTITLDGDGLILEPTPPAGIITLLKAVKPDLLRVLAGREAARAAFNAQPPPGCSERGWALAMRGLHHFVDKGYGDQAAARMDA